MTAVDEENADAPVMLDRRWSRRRRFVVGALVVVLTLLLVLWWQRRTIAEEIVRRELAARGVPATYRIEKLGFGRQRLADVVIGDTARPDLVADWVEVGTRVRFGLPEVTAVRAGRVRMRAVLRDGTVSFGQIDKLLPPPSGKPFALPAIDLAVADGRMRLDTPFGRVGLKLAGSGVLNDGFAGHLAAVAPAIALDGCRIEGASAAVAVRIRREQPSFNGPVRLGRMACGDIRLGGLSSDMNATLGAAFDRWQGRADLRIADVRSGAVRAQSIAGDVGFAGDARRTEGQVDLSRPPPPPLNVTIAAEPLNIEVDLGRAAVIVVDMQNNFCAPGGLSDHRGVDLAPERAPIAPLKATLPALRAANVPVIWLNWGNRPDRKNLPPMALYAFDRDGSGSGIGGTLPHGRGPVLEKGSWSAAVIDELDLVPGDIHVDKYRISGFWDTPLDSILRNLDVKTIFFAGVNLDICVFHTLADAHFLGYNCILLEDCCGTTSPDFCVQATLWNVKKCFGFVARSDSVCRALEARTQR